jgi:hypothetical protein
MKTEMLVGGRKIELGLDRTVIGLPYPSFPKTDEDLLPQEIVNFVHDKKKEFHASMKYIESTITDGIFDCIKVKHGDLQRYKVLSEVDGKLLCIFSLGFSYGTGVINIEFNPSKLTQDNFAELSGLFCVLFDDHYGELYKRGVVAHAEFYIDVHGESLPTLVLIEQGNRVTTKHKGTTYLGKRTSKLVTTMYDKAKQSGIDGKIVRTEARINRRDIHFKDFVEKDQFNPFSNALVVEQSTVQTVSMKWQIPVLANNVVEFGLGMIANKHARKAILEYLKEHAVPWWQPDMFWSAHRELLLQLKPGHAGVFA